MAAVNVKLNPVGIGLIALAGAGILVYMTGLPSLGMSASNDQVNMRELLSASIDLARVFITTF